MSITVFYFQLLVLICTVLVLVYFVLVLVPVCKLLPSASVYQSVHYFKLLLLVLASTSSSASVSVGKLAADLFCPASYWGTRTRSPC